MTQVFKPAQVPQKPRMLLHNATEKSISVMYGGALWVVPPRDKIIPPETGATYFCGFDEDGDPIPGTIGVYDTSQQGGADFETTVEATAFLTQEKTIEHILGIDRNTGECKGVYARMGLSFIPDGASKAQVAEIVEAGKKRARKFLYTRSLNIVAQYEDRNEQRRRNGQSDVGYDEKYLEAMRVVREHEKDLEEERQALMAESPVVQAQMDEDETVLAEFLMLESEAKKLAEEYIPQATAAEQAEYISKLLKNPKTRAALDRRREYQQIRKIRRPAQVKEEPPQKTELVSPPEEPPSEEATAT